ncbi:Fe-only nitrogenase accessory AnfO family protein [Dendrosporobacter sp. 1207_IL3150]|uniref:Fe-only nitrogenase accessory AnfO family protein n=1 Tax=Dendrosporobacter sp. 1207_IL3150 TaxID=3084054 RepID=UPI002FD89A94
MALSIAVLVGDDGRTISAYEPGWIIVFQKQQGVWNVIEEKNFDLEQSKGVRSMRQKIDENVEFIAAKSKVFVALNVNGIFYFELEKAGLSIWEFEGKPDEFLDYIINQEEAAELAREQITPVEVPRPKQTSPGEYTFSLKEIQENNSSITSKQALLPFVKAGTFTKLEISCNHIPLWLEAIALEGNYTCLKEQINSKEVKVTLIKNTK